MKVLTSSDMGDGLVRIDADRIPLALFEQAISALRSGPTIAPPETGSAGLAAQRP